MTSYVVITPAHNEETFIEKTITSVIAQTIRPLKWVIVNDASTDRTREIVEGYTQRHRFIELVNIERSVGRHFGNKVRAFNQGLEQVCDLYFDYVGNLDADVSFAPDYFENILREFARDPKLGIAGGMIHTRLGDGYVSQEVALDSVAGAVQLFRRACFEQVGGYMVLPYGGIDTAAEVTARMKGWKVRTFPEFHVLEHRRTGSATARPLASRVKEGRRLQTLGYGAVFFFLRCLHRAKEQPKVVGSCAAFWGFLASKFGGEPIALPPEAVRYLRAEHRAKLKRLFHLPSASS
ncbi:MAG: glycosyltransferase family 2 protein [Verrucomicrobia bacterium]|nr:glycosyltransferase family 2 protein [Verrucomicrobiota bacterium]